MGARLKGMVPLIAALLMLPQAGDAQRLRSLSTADDNRGWEAVGRLNLGSSGFCTAALVTSDIVLTAAHCLFDKTSRRRIPTEEIEFQAGLRHGHAEAHRGIRRIVMHPDYDFHDENRLGRVGSDVALLELDRPVRLGHVRPFRTQFRVSAGQEVQVVSYAHTRADAPSREEDCSILTRDDEVLVLSCSVDFGSSGAPVFASYDGEMRIVSVISAKAVWEGQPVALAAVMEGQLSALLSEFAQTPAFAPVAGLSEVEEPVDTSAGD